MKIVQNIVEKNEWTVLQKFDSVTLPTLMYEHFNVRLAFVYSSGKCMSHKSRPMLQKNPNMARNSNSRNYYFGINKSSNLVEVDGYGT